MNLRESVNTIIELLQDKEDRWLKIDTVNETVTVTLRDETREFFLSGDKLNLCNVSFFLVNNEEDELLSDSCYEIEYYKHTSLFKEIEKHYLSFIKGYLNESIEINKQIATGNYNYSFN